MDAKELAFKTEALEHGLAHIAIQNKAAMVELMLNIDETWKARSEKSWFETELDKVDNEWGKAGTKLGHDSITDHVVVKPVERWKPEEGEKYWYVTIDCGVSFSTWKNDSVDNALFGAHNCFRSEQDVIAARERVKKALLG